MLWGSLVYESLLATLAATRRSSRGGSTPIHESAESHRRSRGFTRRDTADRVPDYRNSN